MNFWKINEKLCKYKYISRSKQKKKNMHVKTIYHKIIMFVQYLETLKILTKSNYLSVEQSKLVN